MFNITEIQNKYFLRNSLTIPFFYKKFCLFLKPISNLIHFMTIGRIASGVLHDIVNPLTSLLISINFNQNTNKELAESGKELSDFIRVVQTQLKNVSEKEKFNLFNTIQDSCILLKHKAISNGVRIVMSTEQNINLFGNKTLLIRVLINLINNAIESYENTENENKDVIISVYKCKKFVNIKIKDFGCGMTDKERKKIFNYFYTNKATGTGLGLYISQRNIRKEFLGKIEVLSELNKGSSFIIKIPLKTSV
jgi:signal transduction histidine kinase